MAKKFDPGQITCNKSCHGLVWVRLAWIFSFLFIRQDVHLATHPKARYSGSSCNVALGVLAASFITVYLVLLSVLENHPVLGNVMVVPQFLHLTVIHGTSNVLESPLYLSPDQYLLTMTIHVLQVLWSMTSAVGWKWEDVWKFLQKQLIYLWLVYDISMRFNMTG